MINWNGRNAIISSYWVCLFTKFRWRLHRALRLAWITWIPFILWFSMIFKIGLNIVHGFMNATFIDDSLYQWSLTINVHSCIYEHTSCMINDHRNSYEHWSSMIIDIDYDSWRSMIVAMKCCWSYMISVDHCIISWPLLKLKDMRKTLLPRAITRFWINHFSWAGCISLTGKVVAGIWNDFLGELKPEKGFWIVSKWAPWCSSAQWPACSMFCPITSCILCSFYKWGACTGVHPAS